jgi:DNA-binding response OmpR family regulator
VTGPCILIIEEDGLIRTPLAEYLRECGYQVLEAVSAEEARQLLASDEWRVDIVLADARPLDQSGFSVGAWIKREHPDVAVILVGTVAKAAEKAGELCDDGPAISKPYDYRIVLDRIRRLLAARDRNERKR